MFRCFNRWNLGAVGIRATLLDENRNRPTQLGRSGVSALCLVLIVAVLSLSCGAADPPATDDHSSLEQAFASANSGATAQVPENVGAATDPLDGLKNFVLAPFAWWISLLVFVIGAGLNLRATRYRVWPDSFVKAGVVGLLFMAPHVAAGVFLSKALA